MATRWLYSVDGKPQFWVDDATLYAHPGGKPSFYISDGWVYSYDGKPAYWIDDKWLYEHPGGRAALYFSD
jgi:hypothetical protein